MSVRAHDARGPIEVLAGQIAVECRLVLTVTCPVCGAAHRKLLDVGDHPELAGDRIWSLRCHGVRYVAHVQRARFVEAQQRATAISTRYGLGLSWLATEDPHTHPEAPSETFISLSHRSVRPATRHVKRRPTTTAGSATSRTTTHGNASDSSRKMHEERPQTPCAPCAPKRRLWLVESSLATSISSKPARRAASAPPHAATWPPATDGDSNRDVDRDASSEISGERREPQPLGED